MVESLNNVNLCVFLGYAHISDMLLKLLGKLPHFYKCLVHSCYAHLKVELIALKPVLDMLNYLPPGGITTICSPSPINLHCPQSTTSLQPRIYIWTYC